MIALSDPFIHQSIPRLTFVAYVRIDLPLSNVAHYLKHTLIYYVLCRITCILLDTAVRDENRTNQNNFQQKL
jgi:hypothetical protein